jgi:hypothetical protein
MPCLKDRFVRIQTVQREPFIACIDRISPASFGCDFSQRVRSDGAAKPVCGPSRNLLRIAKAHECFLIAG